MAGHELILTENGLYFQDRLLAQGVESLHCFENFIIYATDEATLFLKLADNSFIQEACISKSIVYQGIYNDTAIFTSDLSLDDFTIHYDLINFKSGEVILSLGRMSIWKGIFRHRELLFLYEENAIACIDDRGRRVWEAKENVPKINHIIGFFKNQLVLACGNHTLLSIDIHTGKTNQCWRELPGFDAGGEYRGVLPEPTDFVLDKDAGKLVGVFSKYYLEIDLLSGQISYEDVRAELIKHRINSFRRMTQDTALSKNHLFLTAHAESDDRPNVDLDCVLAFNRKTKAVDWLHVFKDTGVGTNLPQITNTHLYQLDTENNLFVFEKA